MQNLSRIFTIALLVTIAVSRASAQVASGTIVGVAADPTGAVVPSVSITIVHVATKDTRKTQTNERGEFNVPFVRTGEYSITAEKQGFRPQTQTGIVVQVDQTVRVELALQIGALTEQVEVTAAAPLMDTSTSSLGQVIGNKQILDLPLNGRNAFALGLLAGNTIPVQGMGTNLPFVTGGGRFGMNDVLLDGVDNNTSVTSGSIGRAGIAYTPSVDAVEEFKVKTSNFSAEFGRSAGGIISATIKSGTNTLHGSGWEFLRNDKLDANNFFSNASGTERQAFKQNQFGFTLGGPVELPKIYHGRNKTFFFGDYEGTRRRTTASSSVLDIPPLAFRTGDFSAYKPTIFDPRARRIGPSGSVISMPLPGNRIPQALINPGSAATLALLPTPNFGGPDALSRNYLRIAPRPYDNDQFDVKIDHRLGDSDTLSGRFSLANSTNPNPGSFDGFIGAGSREIRNTRSAALSETHIFSPAVVNEFRAGYARHNGSSVPNDTATGVDFALNNKISMFPFPLQAFPAIQFAFSGINSSAAQFSSIGGGNPNLAIENTFEYADNLSINRGNHTFKIGGDFRRYRFDNISGGGTLIFGSIFSSSSDTPGSGAPLADFLFGYPSNTDGKQLLDWSRQRDLYAGFFFQDDWKISPHLTLNMGIRYDLFTQPVDDRDRGGLFDLTTGKNAIPGKGGFSRAIVDPDHNNFAPRLGFAYNATSKFTIRSGAGIFFARKEQNQGVTQIGANIPNTPTVLFPVISASGTVTPPVTISSPIELGASDPDFTGVTAANPVSFNTRAPDFHNVPAPYVAQWNLSLQYAVQQDLMVEASYSGTKGTKLIARANLNQIRLEDALAGHTTQADRPYPQINNTVGIDAAIANSFYNALNLRVEKRYRAGFAFMANYTWSKNLESNGNGDSSFNQNGGTTLPIDSYNLFRERSYAPLDVPHVFNFNYAYELPFGTGKRWMNHKGPANWVLGGWQFNGILSIRSGFPTDIRSARIASGNQMYATLNVPDRVTGVSMYLPNKSVDGYFNPAAFVNPQQVRNTKGTLITLFGNSARRVARGPGSSNLDFSMFKNFRPTERLNVQFRAEAFNLSNTPTFTLPSASNSALTIGNPGFGRLASSSATGRQLQFGLKLSF
ncbi:MAG: TonB-dependent receptor [Acidobacteriota bacterium]